MSYGSSFSWSVTLDVTDTPHPPHTHTILWHHKQPDPAHCGQVVELCPEDIAHLSCDTVALIFDILDDGQLRHGFLDPQSRESSGRVGIPALSHQFAHHTQSLVHHGEDGQK